MPKSAKRIEEEREFRRGRIADAAMRLFAEHGFSAVSVEQVAEASEYTRVSVYNHFRGKPMIFLYLVRRETSRLLGELRRRVPDDLDPVEAFGELLETLIDALEKQRSFFELYFFERERVQRDMDAEEVAQLEAAQFRIEGFARTLFQRGIDQGAFHDADAATATNLFFAGFAGSLLLYRTHHFEASLPQLLRANAHFFLRSLGAASGPFQLPSRKIPTPRKKGASKRRA